MTQNTLPKKNQYGDIRLSALVRVALVLMLGHGGLNLGLGRLTLVDRGGQDLRAEGKTLGSLNDLLVHGGVVGVHEDGVFLVVNLGVHTGVTDQVDDPLLTLFLGHVQGLRQFSNVDLLVDAAVSLADEAASVLDKLLLDRNQEEIVFKDLLALSQLLLGQLEIEVDVESLNKLSDGVLVLV